MNLLLNLFQQLLADQPFSVQPQEITFIQVHGGLQPISCYTEFRSSPTSRRATGCAEIRWLQILCIRSIGAVVCPYLGSIELGLIHVSLVDVCEAKLYWFMIL